MLDEINDAPSMISQLGSGLDIPCLRTAVSLLPVYRPLWERDVSGTLKVKIFGQVLRRQQNGARRPVLFGVYVMEEVSPNTYRFTGDVFTEPFELNLEEVCAYMGSQMTIIGGQLVTDLVGTRSPNTDLA